MRSTLLIEMMLLSKNVINNICDLPFQVNNDSCCFIPYKGNEVAHHSLVKFASSCSVPLYWLEESSS